MIARLLALVAVAFIGCADSTQPPEIKDWQSYPRVTDASLRGIWVVNDKVAWASGSKGTFLKTTNGKDWKADTIAGATGLDFRDIHAFNENVAYVISAGEIAKIFKTTDGGKSWQQQYFNDSEGVFFDGLTYKDTNNGIAYSDPIDGKWLLIKTEDGQNWEQIPSENLPPMTKDEAGFAASGTGICNVDNNVWIASGNGEKSRVFRSEDWGKTWEVFELSLIHI